MKPTDYRQFLQEQDEAVRLPYFRGNSVCDNERTYRIRTHGRLTPGWYQFRRAGRWFTMEMPIKPELDAWELSSRIGYIFNGLLISNNSRARLFGIPKEIDLPKFTPVGAREWFDGHILYYGPEFESEAESQVRQAFEDGLPIKNVKGVCPALAHVFLLESTQQALAREKMERERHEAELAGWQQTLEGRISLALSHTGAELIDWRRFGHGQAVVRYRLGGQRFECVIDTQSLQILDAGICLSGADEELNLSSLPSAVREAINTGQLHIFRRA